MRRKTILTWHIPTFDRTPPDPLPFKVRHYVLDWSAFSPSEAAEVEALVDRKRTADPPVSPSGPDETVVTFSTSRQVSNSNNWRRYRKHFVERPTEQLHC